MPSERPPGGTRPSRISDLLITPQPSASRSPSPAESSSAPNARDTLTSTDVSAPPTSIAAMLTTATPQTSSQPSDQSMPDAMESVKYTKTGRISRANKGKRVHLCPECGRTYTRAEHLRRHQKNHQPGEFPCDVPGCTRSFFREDLLSRHKARHNDPNAAPSPVPPESPGSLSSGPGVGPSLRHPSISYANPVVSAPPPIPTHMTTYPTQSESRQPAPLGKRHSAEHILPGTRHATTMLLSDSFTEPTVMTYLPDESPRSSPYGSPMHDQFSHWPYYQPHQPMPGRLGSEASIMSGYRILHSSRSPVSVDSSTYLPHCGWDSQAHSPPLMNPLEQYGPEWGVRHMSYQSDPESIMNELGSVQSYIQERDRNEALCLIVPTAAPESSPIDSQYSNEQRYLGAYFTHIHHFLPVVHRPSFSPKEVSPLLKAAMLALGAQALPDRLDKMNARTIHEKCLKVLKARTLSNFHNYRLSDLQAILLVEVFAIYKSRRPPLQFSQSFELICSHLAADVEILNPFASTESPYQSCGGAYNESILEMSRVEARCKHRVLIACYVLDIQHSTLFGRTRLGCFSGLGLELSLPSDQATWDNKRRASTKPSPTYAQMPFDVDWSERDESDCFQSMLMMCMLADDSLDVNSLLHCTRGAASIAHCLEKQARTEIAYHTLMLCKSTPVRDLLAVAGESWVMAEKLIDSKDFTMAQLNSLAWAQGDESRPSSSSSSSPPANGNIAVALRHALRILELHHNHPTTGVFFQEWSLYLATIVVWARAYVSSSTPHRDPALQPVALSSSASSHELDQAVLRTVANGSEAPLAMPQARAILCWTKGRLEKVNVPHCTGLVNGALDFMGKLVGNGDEVGWFGM